MTPKVTAIILAGGKGTRLEPLTRDRAKPAVPFAGMYRIIDFTLTNCVHSHFRRIQVLTQFKSLSLDRHIQQGWNYKSPFSYESIDILHAQQRIDEHWYQGTADAIYQNIYSLEYDKPDYIVVLAGDHVYRMDYQRMLQYHIAAEADVTLGCVKVPTMECHQFGIVKVDGVNRIQAFVEKPNHTDGLPHDPSHVLGSMGIYIFSAKMLYEQLCIDATDEHSGHDFGRDIIPRMIDENYRLQAYHLPSHNSHSPVYWRDVGTIDTYFSTHMDLLCPNPDLDLFDESWPILTRDSHLPPALLGRGKWTGRLGESIDSLLSPSCQLLGGKVFRSVLSPSVVVKEGAEVEDSILFDRVQIGENCKLRRVIIDKDVVVPAGTIIGYDLEDDRERGFTISDQGVIVVPKREPQAAFFVS